MTQADKEPRRSLLAVDDDGAIRVLLRESLQGQYDILCVPNGPEVPGLVASRKPDLVLLDISVPGSEGYGLCAGVRKQAALQRLPILFMTVRHNDPGFFEDLGAGGNSYIRKPFEISRMKRRIESALKPL
ncbi:MAG: response regulator [Elusimicrobia bacterium]|nr:response regulator [Elusimicrobiota bacterium]